MALIVLYKGRLEIRQLARYTVSHRLQYYINISILYLQHDIDYNTIGMLQMFLAEHQKRRYILKTYVINLLFYIKI